MKFKSANTFYCFVLFFLTACSSDIPTESDLESSISDLFSECKPFQVANVKKTNGRPGEQGSYFVDAEIEMKMEPLEENTELGKNIPSHLELSSPEMENAVRVFTQQQKNLISNCRLHSNFAQYLFNKILSSTTVDTLAHGSTNKFTAEIEMVKTENGWQLK